MTLTETPFLTNVSLFSLIVGLIVAFIAGRADLRRRKLSLAQTLSRGVLATLDLISFAILTGILTVLVLTAARQDSLVLRAPLVGWILACEGVTAFIWAEGYRQIQFQRPEGIVLGELLILGGAYQILQSAAFHDYHGIPRGTVQMAISKTSVMMGAVLIGVTVLRFKRVLERHRILERLAQGEEFEQREYAPATPECPHPNRWHMVDPQSCELEVLEFLKSLVSTVKPQLIVETGTFIGHSAIKMAEGLKANGFGRIITIEYDSRAFAKAKERIDASGLAEWIECRNQSSLETKINGTIDVFFSDSHLLIREKELRHFLPQISPCGLMLVHDAGSQIQKVREVMLRLEQEGLISTVLLPTPRGIAIAQKRDGRQ